MVDRIGMHKGVRFRLQRICDVLVVDSKARWYFAYEDWDTPTGDHFRTLQDFKDWVDAKAETDA